MKEQLLIKGMDFIGNDLIEVKLIKPVSMRKKVEINESFADIDKVIQKVKNVFESERQNIRIIYMTVDEWKKHNYNFASQVILEIEPEFIPPEV